MTLLNYHLSCGLLFFVVAAVLMAVALIGAPETGVFAMMAVSTVIVGAIAVEAWKKRRIND